jgi:hypothetical protein
MNNPYPSNRLLREKTLADSLLAEQAGAAETFKRALQVFADAFDAMHFPLGSPVVGYDLQDINGIIADLMTLRYDNDYADAAAYAAREAA